MNKAKREPFFTKQQVAEMLGVTTRTVTRYQERPTDPLPVREIVATGGNKYQPNAVLEWAIRQRIKALSAGNEEVPDFNLERARLTRANADKAELELRELQGELLRADLVEKAMLLLVTNFRARILALPSKAAPELLAADGDREYRSILEQHCHDALHELASRGVAETIGQDLSAAAASDEGDQAAA